MNVLSNVFGARPTLRRVFLALGLCLLAVGCQSFNSPPGGSLSSVTITDRTMPQIVKCDLCRRTNLLHKGITACAETCPTGAIKFGQRKELLEEARTRLAQNKGKYVDHIYGEHEAGGTNHLYLAALPFAKLGLPELGPEAPAEFSEKIQHTIYKGFIAPVALYSVLCAFAVKNMKKNQEPRKAHGHPPKPGGKA